MQQKLVRPLLLALLLLKPNQNQSALLKQLRNQHQQCLLQLNRKLQHHSSLKYLSQQNKQIHLQQSQLKLQLKVYRKNTWQSQIKICQERQPSLQRRTSLSQRLKVVYPQSQMVDYLALYPALERNHDLGDLVELVIEQARLTLTSHILKMRKKSSTN